MTYLPGDLCVLVVDDEVLLAEVTAEWLQRKGFRVLTAENGHIAWNILQNTKVDVVITDIRMPVMDGVALLENIHASGASAPGVIFVTAYSDFDARNAYDLGVQNILSKPVRRKELEDAVDRLLQGRFREWPTLAFTPTDFPLQNCFLSLPDAIRRGLIAMGFGGFCLSDCFRFPGVVVPLDLQFAQESQRIGGQGLIRWSDRKEQKVGVEITFIEQDCRDWVVKLLSETGSSSFIPGQTAGGS
jgi:CheY-like chemotaxis protein